MANPNVNDPKFKILQGSGLGFLCTHIKEIKSTAAGAGEAVASLAGATSDGFEEVEGILTDLGGTVDEMQLLVFEVDNNGDLMPPAIPTPKPPQQQPTE